MLAKILRKRKLGFPSLVENFGVDNPLALDV